MIRRLRSGSMADHDDTSTRSWDAVADAVDRYFDRTAWEDFITARFRRPVLRRHQTLQEFVQPLLHRGFLLRDFREPRATSERLRRSARLSLPEAGPVFPLHVLAEAEAGRGGRMNQARDPAMMLSEEDMPFKSQAQRRKFAQLLVEGKISNETFEEWNRETGGAKLPERVKPKPKAKPKARARPRRKRT
jgi:hypothetical protein